MMYNIRIFSERIMWNNTTSCGLCNFPKLIQNNDAPSASFVNDRSCLAFISIAQGVQILRIQILVAGTALRVQLHSLAIGCGVPLPMWYKLVIGIARCCKNRPGGLDLLYKLLIRLRHNMVSHAEGKGQVHCVAGTQSVIGGLLTEQVIINSTFPPRK